MLSNNIFQLSCLKKRVKCKDYVGCLINELIVMQISSINFQIGF